MALVSLLQNTAEASAAVVLLGLNIVTPSLILRMDYIRSHRAVCERALLCCAAFEVTTHICTRKARVWSSKTVETQSKFTFSESLVNILPRWLEGGKKKYKQRVRKAVCVCLRARTHSIPASPNTPWLTVRASAKAPCRICILPTGIIPRVESWTRSRSKRAYFVTKQTTLCAISCCQSSFCSSTLASYHPFLPKAPGR